jgi:hypothetical protein
VKSPLGPPEPSVALLISHPAEIESSAWVSGNDRLYVGALLFSQSKALRIGALAVPELLVAMNE